MYVQLQFEIIIIITDVNCLIIIALKKFKHKVVERMRDSTADTLGITRAVLVNGMLPSYNRYY